MSLYSLGVSSAAASNQNPRRLDENTPFLPDARVAALLGATHGFPRPVAELVAGYAIQHFDDVIFGPGHWQVHYGATPVTLPPLEELRKRVAESGKIPPKPLLTMRAEECANFLGELGEEDRPQPPNELREFLNQPIAPGEKPAGFICAVTYIPQYVRKDDKVLSVAARTLIDELGPKPKLGYLGRALNPYHVLMRTLTHKDAEATQPPCYFVMELDVAPATKGLKPFEAIAQIRQQADGSWDVPDARNFLATVFTRCVWKKQYPFGREPLTYTYGKGRSRENKPLFFGGFGFGGLFISHCFKNKGNGSIGAAGSRKFAPAAALKSTL